MSYNTLTEMFIDVVKQHGARTALMTKVKGQYEGFTYEEFGRRVRNFALGLAALGIEKGDRVALFSENRPEWAITDLACLSLGATPCPIYPTLTESQIKYILADSESKCVVASKKEFVDKILKMKDNIKPLKHIIAMEPVAASADLIQFSEAMEKGRKFGEKHPDYYDNATKNVADKDLAGLIYTSGTTGNPKGVMLSHKNIMSNVLAGLNVLSVSCEDVWLSFLPLCHVFERMAGHFCAITKGCTIAYAESIDTVAQNLLEVRPTIMTSVPRLFEKIYSRVISNAEAGGTLKKKIFYWALGTGEKYNAATKAGKVTGGLKFKYNLANKLVFSKLQERTGGRIRFFISGGGPLPKEIGEFFYSAGIKVLEGYGLTESSPVISVNHLDNFKFGSVGLNLPGQEVKIADDGEILTRGPHVMQGYFKQPEATKEVLDADGWLHTGDIGFIDEDEFLTITDRKKNLIVTSGGKNVAPQPMENALLTSQYIQQVMILGDSKKFISALIVPDFGMLEKYANEHNIPYSNMDDLVSKDEIYRVVEKEVDRLLVNFARFEKVKKFLLLSKEFTIEDGELTPTLKVKRKVVLDKYKDQIDKLYKE
ncbi:long-chain fatty acid--CoA ligase [candidate division KSB1 bacterium]|nr:long-chain fatty acid--CoA ligase [candidate division KSB1 bacterium]